MCGLVRDNRLSLLGRGGRIGGFLGGYQSGLDGYFWANLRACGWCYVRRQKSCSTVFIAR